MKKNARLEKQFARKFLNHEGRQNAGAVEEIKAVSAVMQESPEIRGFLEGPQFSAEEKKRLLAELAKKLPLSGGTLKFLEHLAELDVASLVPGIARSAELFYMEYARRVKAVVASASGLDGASAQRLKAALEKITGREVEMEHVSDPSLIGGVRVKIGSMMFDSSLRGQLRLLKEELIKG